MKRIFSALVLAGCVGCASKPVVYHPPSSAKMDTSTERLHQSVVQATAVHKQAQGKVAEVKSAVTEQKQHIDALGIKLDELFKIAPVELRDEVDAARYEFAPIRADNQQLAEKVDGVVTMQATEGNLLEQANANDKQSQADKEEYKADAAQLAEQASAESVRRATAENRVRELESKNWIRRALEAIAALALCVLAFLWFTGKLTLSAASIASKIP